ncbi:Imm8 family immunity protein [Paenibacillus terreus]|uniref:Imm8 family immunity protein n=1 Tax=Paenibacillus terreus TaxID=1387834 RepID=A0ABV5B8K0_9BACL
MLVIKTLTRIYEDWGDDIDDFYITDHIDIGPKEINGASDLFSFELVSPKRLERMADQGGIIIGRGHMITSDFNENKLEETLSRIVNKCADDDISKANNNLSKYFRWEMDE